MIINFKCFITVSLLKRLEMKTQRLPQPLYTKSFHLQIKCYKPKKKKKKNHVFSFEFSPRSVCEHTKKFYLHGISNATGQDNILSGVS